MSNPDKKLADMTDLEVRDVIKAFELELSARYRVVRKLLSDTLMPRIEEHKAYSEQLNELYAQIIAATVFLKKAIPMLPPVLASLVEPLAEDQAKAETEWVKKGLAGTTEPKPVN